ncbi:MAG: hypothetical protein HY716_09030 [Planctomycetes bacterium]|nr:hypothetical protein [Planctomycetota bacterium]
MKSVHQVLKEHSPEIMKVPGVVGTAESQSGGEPCILVFVVAVTPEISQRIPHSLDGYPVLFRVTGEFRA